MNKLSHTAIDRYLNCPRFYRNYYIEKIRTTKSKSALFFGNALDSGFNLLFEGKSLMDAKQEFLKEWTNSKLNGQPINLSTSDKIIFTKNDTDEELLEHFNMLNSPNKPWSSLLLKGYLILEACNREILPKIEKTLAIQKQIILTSSDGDQISGKSDIIAKFKDGKTRLMDNKSSTVKYEPDSPKKSQQLVLYYYVEKDLQELDEVGFFVFNKNINKNKLKTCLKCGFKATSAHKTCYNTKDEVRCHGEWKITYNPICEVTMITNEVEESDIERVIEDIDTANLGIKAEHFEPNFNSCITKFGKCDYYKLCHENNMEDLTVLKKEEKNE